MLIIADTEILMGQSAPDKQTAITTLATLLAERNVVRVLANLMGLGVHAGSKVTFVVEGDGSDAVLKALKTAIDAGLGEQL